MVTYDFYKNTYLGSALTEEAFPQALVYAKAWLESIERVCRVECPGPDSRAMALCAVAETMAAWKKRQFIASTTVGGVSVRYEAGQDRLQKQLLQNAGTFVTIRRGVA